MDDQQLQCELERRQCAAKFSKQSGRSAEHSLTALLGYLQETETPLLKHFLKDDFFKSAAMRTE